jgi:hypothetical protein
MRATYARMTSEDFFRLQLMQTPIHAAAHHDGVADGERLQGRGQQHPAADLQLQIDLVGDGEIVVAECLADA